MFRLAVLDDFQGVASGLADWGSLPETEVVFFRDHVTQTDRLVDLLRPFDALIAMRERTPFPRPLLGRLPRLRLLVTTGMRNASIDMRAAAELGITVCGTGGSATNTAELTWALILAVVRKVPAEDTSVRAGGWQLSVGADLAGRTLGVLGLGRIGSRVARVARAFDMNVIAWSQNLSAEAATAAGAVRVEKQELFARSDVLTIHLVLSERTRGLVGAAELALMKPTAFLVNTSRGPIVDEAALIDVLKEDRIAGAGLDVYDVEPLPLDHPLRNLHRTVVTPHLGYVSWDAYQTFFGEAVEDVAAFLTGRPLRVLARPSD
jgi:phosphoglycerate dehydrogenase-like enzyme